MAALSGMRSVRKHVNIFGLVASYGRYSRQNGIHIHAHCQRLTGRLVGSSTLRSRWQVTPNIRTLGGAVISLRFNSTDPGSENLVDNAVPLIDPAAISEVATTAQDILQTVKDVPFSELGLGGYTPVGVLQSLLEFIHVSGGLPWWATIAVGTLIARTCVFPFIVKNQQYAAKLNNVMPTFQKMTAKMTEARHAGNQAEMTRRSLELQRFMKKHNVNPLKSFVGVLVQAPIFISFFIALRRMANLPVESMMTGGLWWFTDLTTADPYYILPVLSSLSMLAVLELGGEAGVNSTQMQKMKTVFRVMPFILLPVMASMPKAVFVYWLTSNMFSLGQVALLKIPVVRRTFNIPEKIKHKPENLPKKEGFIDSVKSGWKNAQFNHDVDQKGKAHVQKMKEAGTGPIPQTFNYDPTKQQVSSPSAGMSTSSRTAKEVRRKKMP